MLDLQLDDGAVYQGAALQALPDIKAARKLAQAAKLAQKKASLQPDRGAWLAWFDGATSPNPGKMGIGALLQSPQGETLEISFAAGHGDSNEAEYLALIAVLEAAVGLQPDKLMVYGDSQVVINDVNNRGSVGAVGLQIHSKRAKQLMAQFKSATLTWLPRQKNTAADALSQQALGRLVKPS